MFSLVKYLQNSCKSYMKFLLHAYHIDCSFSTKACRPIIFFKVVLASLKVANLPTSIVPSLEIPSCSWINTWSMKISWPHIRPWILPSSIVSQVLKKSRNRYFLSVVHYMLNMTSKLAYLAHLNLLESIFIHYNIFWISFALDIVFFLTSFSTCSSTCPLPFHFIMALVFYLKH